MNTNVLHVIQSYLALSAQDRIGFLKEVHRRKMHRIVKKDHEIFFRTIPLIHKSFLFQG